MGCQQPTWRLAKPYALTQAPYFIELGRRCGIHPYEWQEGVLNDWLSVDDQGRYVHYRNGLEVPRQNGKTAALEIRILGGTVLKRESFVYTAHDYSTVQRLFDRLMYFFGEKANDPDAKFKDLNKLVKSVRKAVSKEAIFLKNGASIWLATRTKTAKLGFTADVFIADEAQELENIHLKAILSTVSHAPLGNPQLILCGTPPTPDSSGDVFAHIRYAARAGTEDDLGWNEWSHDEIGDIFDQERWYRVNPTLGQGLSITAIHGESKTYTEPITFAQQRLGYWLPEKKTEKPPVVIDRDEWDSCSGDPPELTGEEIPCFAIKFSIDGQRASIAAAVKLPDGRIFVDIPTFGNRSAARSIKWATDFFASVATNAAEIVIDGKAHAADLEEDLLERKVPKRRLRIATPSEVADACSMLTSAVSDQRILHTGQQPVSFAIENTTKRKIGTGGGFGFEASVSGADPTLLEAIALVFRAAKTTKRNPRRKARIG